MPSEAGMTRKPYYFNDRVLVTPRSILAPLTSELQGSGVRRLCARAAALLGPCRDEGLVG